MSYSALYGLVVVLAAISSYSLTALFLGYSRKRNLVDLPGPRRSHLVPTPRGGGAGIVLVVLGLFLTIIALDPASTNWVFATAPGFILIAIQGWLDDHRPVSSAVRLLGQLAAASWFVIWVDSPSAFFLSDAPAALDIWQQGLAVLLIVWVTNVHNFMDGSDWMISLQTLVLCLFLAWGADQSSWPALAIMGLGIAAACLGFLPWNRTPAKIFLGDVASGPLGFLLVCLALASASESKASGIVFVLLYGAFFFDAIFTLLRRFFSGQKWYTAHCEHAYQRLVQGGRQHITVAWFYALATIVFFGPLSILTAGSPKYAVLALVSSGFLAMAIWICVQSWHRKRTDNLNQGRGSEE